MGQVKTILILVLFLCSSLAGCLSEDENGSRIDLVVDFEENNGTVVESYYDGELTSTNIVSLDFDFSKTTASNTLTIFGIDTMDGRSAVTVDAKSNSVITVEFSEHGIYNLSVYAIDDDGNQNNMSLPIRIELRIEWVESNTNDPKTLIFDPNPVNGGQNPQMIEVDSTVENPSLIDGVGGSGQAVQFTWGIADEVNDVCQSRSGEANDGESDNWYTLHFNTYLIHELRISYDDGQDPISINQSVTILYDSGES